MPPAESWKAPTKSTSATVVSATAGANPERKWSANIYLHYVLDLWIEKRVAKGCRGEVIFMRYADDLIVGFETQSDAERYLAHLPERLAKFNLCLAEEKSGLVKFNRWEPKTSGVFTFLGFDFHWSPTVKNPKHWVVKRKTNKKKYRASLRAMKDWLKPAWNYYCVNRGRQNDLAI
jgi:RNA-directed DNA polymerase